MTTKKYNLAKSYLGS